MLIYENSQKKGGIKKKRLLVEDDRVWAKWDECPPGKPIDKSCMYEFGKSFEPRFRGGGGFWCGRFHASSFARTSTGVELNSLCSRDYFIYSLFEKEAKKQQSNSKRKRGEFPPKAFLICHVFLGRINLEQGWTQRCSTKGAEPLGRSPPRGGQQRNAKETWKEREGFLNTLEWFFLVCWSWGSQCNKLVCFQYVLPFLFSLRVLIFSSWGLEP